MKSFLKAKVASSSSKVDNWSTSMCLVMPLLSLAPFGNDAPEGTIPISLYWIYFESKASCKLPLQIHHVRVHGGLLFIVVVFPTKNVRHLTDTQHIKGIKRSGTALFSCFFHCFL